MMTQSITCDAITTMVKRMVKGLVKGLVKGFSNTLNHDKALQHNGSSGLVKWLRVSSRARVCVRVSLLREALTCPSLSAINDRYLKYSHARKNTLNTLNHLTKPTAISVLLVNGLNHTLHTLHHSKISPPIDCTAH